MPHKLIHTHALSGCRLEMVEGSEVISRHHLFVQLLIAELGEDKASILAEPVKNVEHNRINWYTNLTGEVKAFAELSEEEQKTARDTISAQSSEFAALSERLIASGATNRNLAGALLVRIFSRPEDLNIYQVGDKTVVAGWGLVDSKAAVAGGDMMEDSQNDSVRPKSIPLAESRPPAVAAVGMGGCLRTLLRLLLSLFLGFLLAFLLLYFVSPSLWENLKAWFTSPPLDHATFDLNVDQEASLRSELTRLKKEYGTQLLLCNPAESKPIPETVPEPGMIPEPEAKYEPETEPGTEHGTETVYDPETETVYDPETETVYDPETETEYDPETETVYDPETETEYDPETETEYDPETETEYDPETTPETERETERETEHKPRIEAGTPMTIPEDAAKNNDFSFMEGCWTSERGDMVSSATGQPIIYIYCFNRSGKAGIRIYEKDDNDNLLDTCRSKATSSFKNEFLVIIDRNGPKCTDGRRYYGATVTCRPDKNGQTICSLQTNKRGKAPFDSTFKRIYEF